MQSDVHHIFIKVPPIYGELTEHDLLLWKQEKPITIMLQFLASAVFFSSFKLDKYFKMFS